MSSEVNSRLSREVDEMVNSFNTHIQRAISDAITNQILPRIQNALKAGSGHVTQKRWNVPVERQEINPEDYRSEEIRSNSRCECSRTRLQDEFTDQAYDRNLPYLDFPASKRTPN